MILLNQLARIRTHTVMFICFGPWIEWTNGNVSPLANAVKKQPLANDQFRKIEMIVNGSKCGKLTEKPALQELLLQQTANLALLPASISLFLNRHWPFLVQELLFWSLRDEEPYVNLQRQLIEILSYLPLHFMQIEASRRFRFWCCTYCCIQ